MFFMYDKERCNQQLDHSFLQFLIVKVLFNRLVLIGFDEGFIF